MKICIPVEKDDGIDSPVCAHFGSAPVFMIVDTDSLTCKAVKNNNQHHAHGMCQPLATLSGEQFDGIVVGGIGAGALGKLQSANIKVYQTGFSTIKETVEAYKNSQLKEVTPHTACNQHHGHGHQHGHHHGHGHGR